MKHGARSNRFSREELNQTIDVCRPCHNQIHALWSEKELADSVNTLELIIAADDMRKFVKWIGKKEDGFRPKVREKKK